LAQGHFAVFGNFVEAGKNLLDGNLLFQILLCPSVVVELELWWSERVKIGVGDVERVKVSNVVTSDLVSTDEELNLMSAIVFLWQQILHALSSSR